MTADPDIAGLTRAFMETRAEVHGGRPDDCMPSHDNAMVARRLLQVADREGYARADFLELCTSVFRDGHLRKHASGGRPIATMKYFERPMLEALRDAVRPLEALPAASPWHERAPRRHKYQHLFDALKGTPGYVDFAALRAQRAAEQSKTIDGEPTT